MPSVTVRDEAPGARVFELDIELDSVHVTAADLIRGRVIAELTRVGGVVPRPLVAMSVDEVALNGPRNGGAKLDVEREVARALAAFERGRFMLLVGGRQLQHADEPVGVSADTAITFLRLVSLRGG
jgi:hypothetical protein